MARMSHLNKYYLGCDANIIIVARRQPHLPLRVYRASRALISTAHRTGQATYTLGTTRSRVRAHTSRGTVTIVTMRSVRAVLPLGRSGYYKMNK